MQTAQTRLFAPIRVNVPTAESFAEPTSATIEVGPINLPPLAAEQIKGRRAGTPPNIWTLAMAPSSEKG